MMLYETLLDNAAYGHRHLSDGFWDDLRQAVVVRVDNVARYYLTENPTEEWNLLNDFPNVAPPWPNFWMEYRQPSEINSEGHVRRNPVAGVINGIFVKAVDISDDMDGISRQELAMRIAYSQVGSEAVRRHGFNEGNRMAKGVTPAMVWAAMNAEQREWALRAADAGLDMERPRWSMSAAFFLEDHGRVYSDRLVHFSVMADGSIPQVDGKLGMAVSWIDPAQGDRYVSELKRLGLEDRVGGFMGADTQLHIPLLALSFAHCKNVRLADAEPMPPKLAKKFESKHGRPPVTFKVLEIDPMREVLRREGQSERTGLKRALHICRGHFANYSEERPLFGKVAGQFWIPAHVRGQASEGIVEKQYAIKARKA